MAAELQGSVACLHRQRCLAVRLTSRLQPPPCAPTDVSLAVAKPPATPRGADGEKLRAFTRPDGTVGRQAEQVCDLARDC